MVWAGYVKRASGGTADSAGWTRRSRPRPWR